MRLSRIIRTVLLLLGLGLVFQGAGQITDDFSDGDFGDGTPLTWTASQTSGGDDFVVTSEEVQSNGPATNGDLYLSTNLGIDFINNDVVWTFKVRYSGGGPSGSNRVEIYLFSDVEDVTGSPTGYFIGMGESGSTDGIDLFKTGNSTAIINDDNDLVGSGIDIHVRVTRTSSGTWTLEADASGGDTFTEIGTVTDTDFTSGDYFGLYVKHTSTRFDDFFFDDFSLTTTPLADTDPPTIQSVTAISETQVDVQFNENVDEASAQTVGNYSLNGGLNVSNATRDASDNSIVHLSTSSMTNGTEYTVTINNVEDESGNVIAMDSQETYEYLVLEGAVEFDLVVNEFMAAPSSSSAVPNAEFIELYNRSSKFIDLENWTLSDVSGASSSFVSDTLRPGEYLILTASGNGSLFDSYGDVLEVNGFPSLNNGGDSIIITNSTSTIIHEIAYTSSSSGVSTELINPNGPDYSENNYGQSTDPDGGTPGVQNSIFDDTPDTTPPSISSISVISDTELDVTFDEPLKEAEAETTGNYSIDGGITVSAAMLDESDNTLVHLTLSTLTSGDTRTLTVSGVEDLSGNASSNETIDFEYIETQEAVAGDVVINEFLPDPTPTQGLPEAEFVELYNRSDKNLNLLGWTLDGSLLDHYILEPDEYVIICDNSSLEFFDSFENVQTISSLNLSNDEDQIILKDSIGVEIHVVSYFDSEDGVSTELINPDDPCISGASYSFSVNSNGGTPGQQNSVFDPTPDTESPQVISYMFQNRLRINFSEAMDAASLLNGSYAASGGLTISEILVNEALPTSVDISFDQTIEPGQVYELTISNVQDCSGNLIEVEVLSFGIGRKPGFNDLIITEIMADPDPPFLFPEREYVEIYNTSNEILNLENIVFTDGSKEASLPDINLNPNDYLAVTTSTGATEFDREISIVGVSGFPSLSNDGEQLLLTMNESLIFSIFYSKDWHNSDINKIGGISLEMKDVSNPCGGIENWSSSIDFNRGTPGEQNSISEAVPDNFPPEAISAIAVAADTIKIIFSEKISPDLQQVDFITQPALQINRALIRADLPSSVFLALSQPMEPNILYSLNINAIADCAGNHLDGGQLTFALPARAESDEIKLSEVLFNPRPNGVDFVELYNSSDKFITLKNWQIGSLDEDEFVNGKVISLAEFAFEPQSYLVLTTDTESLLSNYPKGKKDRFIELVSFPSYSNEDGIVALADASGTIKEIFEYHEDYHYSLLESVDGVSLERVSFTQPNNADNWRSASSTEGFATPGYANSQSLLLDSPTGNVSANPEVFTPGNSGSGRDFTTINYDFEQPGNFANVSIYDQNGRLVKKLAQGVLLSSSGFLRWDGDTDGGNLARMGYYLIVFEIYDSNGNSEVIKETVVVGRDF